MFNWIFRHWKSLTATAAMIAFFAIVFYYQMIVFMGLVVTFAVLGIVSTFALFCDLFDE